MSEDNRHAICLWKRPLIFLPRLVVSVQGLRPLWSGYVSVPVTTEQYKHVYMLVAMNVMMRDCDMEEPERIMHKVST